jgi:AcrR family transcriptional regulator
MRKTRGRPLPRASRDQAHRESLHEEEALTDTQRRILTAALEVFSERGYAGASTASIAERAGVAEKTLFAQFKSKSELLSRTLRPSVLVLIEPRAIARVQELMSDVRGSLAQLLEALVNDRIALASAHRKKLKLAAHEALLHPELLDGFRATFVERVAPFAAIALGEMRTRGELRADVPPRTLVRTVVSVILGYALSRFVLGLEDDADDATEIAHIVDVLVNGLKPRP